MCRRAERVWLFRIGVQGLHCTWICAFESSLFDALFLLPCVDLFTWRDLSLQSVPASCECASRKSPLNPYACLQTSPGFIRVGGSKLNPERTWLAVMRCRAFLVLQILEEVTQGGKGTMYKGLDLGALALGRGEGCACSGRHLSPC